MEPNELYSLETLEQEFCRTFALLREKFSDDETVFCSESFEAQCKSLQLSNTGDENAIAQLLRALKVSHVNLRNPHSSAHMVPAPANFSVLGDLIKSYLNQCSFIFEEAPIGQALESVVINWFREVLGLSPGSAGLITSGGTSSNITAMFLAREKVRARRPDVDSKHCILCTPESHLSMMKAARLSGLSERQIIRIPPRMNSQCDNIIADIEARFLAGDIEPVMIASTIGTTGTGEVEELDFHSQLATKFNCWLHLDAAWGGQLALSSKSEKYSRYWQSANSISWDPHKTMFVSYPVGLLFVDRKECLSPLLASSEYALRIDQQGRDPGHLHLEGSRGLDAIKLWLGIKLLGRAGFRELIDCQIETATSFYNFLIHKNEIEVHNPPETSIVCFRFRPMNLPAKELNDLNQYVQKRSFSQGQSAVSLCKIGDSYFLRIVITNPSTKLKHLKGSLSALNIICNEWMHVRVEPNQQQEAFSL